MSEANEILESARMYFGFMFGWMSVIISVPAVLMYFMLAMSAQFEIGRLGGDRESAAYALHAADYARCMVLFYTNLGGVACGFWLIDWSKK